MYGTTISNELIHTAFLKFKQSTMKRVKYTCRRHFARKKALSLRFIIGDSLSLSPPPLLLPQKKTQNPIVSHNCGTRLIRGDSRASSRNKKKASVKRRGACETRIALDARVSSPAA